LVNHVTDPALAAFEKDRFTKFPNGGLCWIQFSLLVELASEAYRSVGTRFWVLEDVLTMEEQLIAKVGLNLSLHDRSWKEINDIHEVIS